MTAQVVDASITLAWILADEVSPAARGVLERIAEEGAVAPSLWRLEVANGLCQAVRRRRCDQEFADLALADLAQLCIEIDTETDVHAWGDTLRLAREHGLSVYDAAYLELAIRRRLPLASADTQLTAAAARAGVRAEPV